MPLPPLSPEQRQAALEKAAIARRKRAELKERLKMGLVSFPELLVEAEHDASIGKLKVLTALESLPGLGKVKARRLLEEVGVADSRSLAGLGSNQRKTLLDRLA